MDVTIVGLIILIIAILIDVAFILYAVRIVRREGFLCISTLLIVIFLFYTVIPILFLCFEQYRDVSTPFNRLLASKSFNEICLCVLECSVLSGIILACYLIHKKKGRFVISNELPDSQLPNIRSWNSVNYQCARKISLIADITFYLGTFAIVMCIVAVGGIRSYIALGSQARGINKSLTDYISGSMLPLITLSGVILASPYLYKYLVHATNERGKYRVKYYLSFAICVIYLLYNQGRLPLLLFFVPFVLDMKIARKARIGTLVVLSVVCVFLLEPLSDLFNYLTYGNVLNRQSTGFLDTLLLEFTYPFSNFLNRHELVNEFGYRYGVDYVQWPLLIIPESLLKIIGLTKSNLETIGSLNTDAYFSIVRLSGGGIPVDIFTFNYYQFGLFSLIAFIPIFTMVLRTIDKWILFSKNNDATRIISLRICILLISLVNNFDFAVIFRMRFDFVILALIIGYIGRCGAKSENEF